MTGSNSFWFANPGQNFYNGATSTSMRFRRGVGSNTEINRDPSSAGDRKKHTLAFWVKRCKPSDGSQIVLCAFASSYSDFAYFRSDDRFEYGVGNAYQVCTDMPFRDVSAWYHIVAHFDVANSTTTSRLRFWVNGVEQSKTVTYGSYPADQDYAFSNTTDQTVGGATHFSGYELDGYLCDLNFIDGSLVPYTSFGEFKNGIWIPIDIDTSAITYGTNGFRMLFNGTDTDGASTSGTVNANSVGASSVNSNHFHAYSTALSDHSALPDNPENNFCTLNPLYNIAYSPGTLTEGNLRYDNSAWNQTASTFAFSSGKWYFEVRADSYNSSAEALTVGIREAGRRAYATYWSQSAWDNSLDGYVYGVNINGTTESKITGASATSLSSNPDIVANSVIGIAIDLDSSTTSIKYNVDGGTLFTLFENMEALTYHPAINGYQAQATVNFGQDSSFAGQETATSNADANGNGTFHSAVPSGYLALCSANLSDDDLTISPNADTQAVNHFGTLTYTGTDADGRTITSGDSNIGGEISFTPDWVWVKARNISGNFHLLFDSARGATKMLFSNEANIESTQADSLSAFNSNGFTVSDNAAAADMNASAHTYVAWNWKAGGEPSADNSAGAGNTPTANSVKIDGSNLGSALAGTIPATRLSANTKAGFSIVTYTGDGNTGASVAHGLGLVPEIILIKNRDETQSWVFNANFTTKYRLVLDTTSTNSGDFSTYMGTQTDDRIVFGDTNHVAWNGSGDKMVAYCFAGVEGYSKFGTYTGNGDADGAFAFLGFRPAWIMIKNISATAEWVMVDSVRSTFNEVDDILAADDTSKEADYGTTNRNIDFLSNGFKIRSTSAGGTTALNTSGSIYIYMAFADGQPFKYANAK